MKGIRISTTAVLSILLISFGLSLGPIQSANAQFSGCPNTWNVQLPKLQLKTDQFGRSRFSFPGESYSAQSPNITFAKYVPDIDKYIQSLKQNAFGTLNIEVLRVRFDYDPSIYSGQTYSRKWYLGSEKLMGYFYAGVVPFWGPIVDDKSPSVYTDNPINPEIRLQIKINLKNCEPHIFTSNSIQIVGDVLGSTDVAELNIIANGAKRTYLNALDNVGDFQVDVPKGLSLSATEISRFDAMITTENSKINMLTKIINDPETDPYWKRRSQTELDWSNTVLKSFQEQIRMVETLNKYLVVFPALIQETKISSWNTETNRNLYPVQKTPTPTASVSTVTVQKTPTPTASVSTVTKKSQSSIVGQTCSQPGQTKTVGNIKFACLVSGKKYQWTAINGPTKNTSPSPNATKSISEADKLVATGCKAFPNAIIRLQNSSGSTYNSALIAAQEAASNINQASRLDGKYGILNNAQFIIIQYAQAVGWGGRGYTGDINTVRTALANFNSSCGSSLKL